MDPFYLLIFPAGPDLFHSPTANSKYRIESGAAWERAELDIEFQFDPVTPLIANYSRSRCMAAAMYWLIDHTAGSRNQARSRACLLMAVMLWEESAHTLHPVLSIFGGWGEADFTELAELGRAAIAVELTEPALLNRWMDAVRSAWLNIEGESARVELPGVAIKSEVPAETGDVRPLNAIPIQRVVQNPDLVAVAVTMKVKNPSLSLREIAKTVGMPYSTLYKQNLWRLACEQLKQLGKGSLRRGMKSEDGLVDACDE